MAQLSDDGRWFLRREQVAAGSPLPRRQVALGRRSVAPRCLPARRWHRPPTTGRCHHPERLTSSSTTVASPSARASTPWAGCRARPSCGWPMWAIGWGWVARRVVRWHMCRFEHVQSVALVCARRPTRTTAGATHPMSAPLPELVGPGLLRPDVAHRGGRDVAPGPQGAPLAGPDVGHGDPGGRALLWSTVSSPGSGPGLLEDSRGTLGISA